VIPGCPFPVPYFSGSIPWVRHQSQVIERFFLWIRKDLIRFIDLLELLLIEILIGSASIRMVDLGQLTISLFDLLLGCTGGKS
jgi:hypothetical protein